MLRNTENSYGLIARILHWVIAFSIIGLISVGFFMSSMEPSPEKFELYGMHKAFGVIVLSLVVLRIIWRLSNKVVLPLADLPNIMKLAAKLGHLLLYIFMLIMPISGVMMSRFGAHDIPVFGLFVIPGLEKNEELSTLFHTIHVTAIWGFIAMILMHIGAAFYHHFIRKDNVFVRIIKQADVS
ncbi:MAG: cytochrome b [Rickettsiaceae bacterium]|nr:cytochrome b [Rickettsiaceae bacterium]